MASMAAMTRRLSQIERHVLMVLKAIDIPQDAVALSRVNHNKECAVRIGMRCGFCVAVFDGDLGNVDARVGNLTSFGRVRCGCKQTHEIADVSTGAWGRGITATPQIAKAAVAAFASERMNQVRRR